MLLSLVAAGLPIPALTSPALAQVQAYAVLHHFGVEPDRWNGAYPVGTLVPDGAGTLYGATLAGGWGWGVVFSLTTDGGNFDVLHRFAGEPDDGGIPYRGLLLSPPGTLYGATHRGGTEDLGTLFALTVIPPGHLFSDGFESQGTGAWSSTAP